MFRAKNFIFVGVGAMAALTIYGAASTKKASNADNGHGNRLARIEALMDEGGVKYRASFFRRSKVTRHATEQIAGLEPVKSVTELTPPAPEVKPDPKADEAKKAAEQKAADEKKKKEDEAKKKKKKKKKKGDKTEEAAAPTQDEAKKDDDKDKKKDDPTALAASGGTTVSYYGGNTAAVNPNPQTVDEWITYLTTNASIEKVNKFIQLSQVNNVKPEVFYPVCEKLLSMDAQFPSYAVLAAGSVTSETSFELLADVANEAGLPDKLKSQATAYMNVYSRFEYIRFLGAAALSKDAVAANDAILLIERSLANVKSLASTQPADPTTASTTRSPASTIAKLYEMLFQDVQSASQTGVTPAVRTSAQTVASQIASVLTSIGGSTTPATPAATTPNPSKQAALF